MPELFGGTNRIGRMSGVLVLALFMATAVEVGAENSSRECIQWVEHDDLGREQNLVIPPTPPGTYVDLGTVEFYLESASDAVVNVAIVANESASPFRGKLHGYMLVDNGHSYDVGGIIYYPLRFNREVASTIHFRVFFKDIPAGYHTFDLKLGNPGTEDIEIGGFWLTPLFVDADNAVISQQFLWQRLDVGSTWNTIGTIYMPWQSDRHLYLSSFIYGIANGDMEFRYVANGQVLANFRKNWGGYDDGAIFNFLWSDPIPGAAVQLQVRGPGMVDWMRHYGITLEKFTVFEASFEGDRNIITDGIGREFLRTGQVQLNSLTMQTPGGGPNQWNVCAWGYASAEMTQNPSREDLISLHQWQNGQDFPWDNGQAEHSPNPVRDIYRVMSDMQCSGGLYGPPNYYEFTLENWAICGPSTLTAHRGRLGIVLTPSPGPHACISSNPGSASCPYSCWLSSGLERVLRPPRNSCNN